TVRRYRRILLLTFPAVPVRHFGHGPPRRVAVALLVRISHRDVRHGLDVLRDAEQLLDVSPPLARPTCRQHCADAKAARRKEKVLQSRENAAAVALSCLAGWVHETDEDEYRDGGESLDHRRQALEWRRVARLRPRKRRLHHAGKALLRVLRYL